MTNTINTRVFFLPLLCSALFSVGAMAADPIGEPGRSADGKNPLKNVYFLSLIHISEPTRPTATSRMPSSA